MQAVTLQVCLRLLEEYEQYLVRANKSEQTIDAYRRILRQFTTWMKEEPEHEQLSRETVEDFLTDLHKKAYSVAHQNKVRAAISRFAKWLVEEKHMLLSNPVQETHVPPQVPLIPREFTDEQRFVLQNLMERQPNLRGKAIFALGYWAGCRVCEVSSLLVADCHLNSKAGWITIGHRDGKKREIDLLNHVRKPLFQYLDSEERQKKQSPYVFLSQKSEHLTENGIHRWFASLKKKATKEEWELIHDITFHELRQDFAYRAKKAGWSLEEITYYLGYSSKQGPPVLETIRSAQTSREQIKERLKQLGKK